MPGKHLDDHLTAKVAADIVLGNKPSRIAAETGVSESTVKRLRARLPLILGDDDPLKKVGVQELVTGYLQQSLATLTLQLEVFGDEAWLKGQPAGELAILHGVLHDKAIRILAAARDVDERDAPAGGGT